MKLDKVILSSNDDPAYLDFWPFVSKAWKNLIGIEPVLFFISNNDEKKRELEKYGEVFIIPPENDWDIVNQSQSIRLWAGTKFPDYNLIISDIDMLPISKEYYTESIIDFPDDHLISYTSDVLSFGFYLRNPQLPMCYLAGKGSTFNEILGIYPNYTWPDFIKDLKGENIRYGTDQQYFWKKFQKWRDKENRYIGMNRGWIEGKIAYKRLDKIKWPETYDPCEYYDSHLPIPYSENEKKCNELFNLLKLI